MKYKVDYSRYTFKEDDDWGDYYNGEYRKPYFNKNGYGWSYNLKNNYYDI